MVNHLGQQFGNYRLTRVLGRGGYAQVYLGEHVYLHTLAALKVQHVHLREDDAQRFLAEARMLAGLEHPHIVPVHDFGVHEGIPYLVMHYAPHGSLRAVHPRGTRLSPASITSYLTPIATAIHYAHERGIIHRDIKPENMLLGSHCLLLSDFGLAVMSSNSSLQSVQHIAGTATYMAPEQLRGYLCQATDQYALGIVAYEWLCGFPPFVGDHLAVATQHIIAPPPSLCAAIPDLSPSVEQAVLKALAKDPHERYSNILAFANALREALHPLKNASPTPGRRSFLSNTNRSSQSSQRSSSSSNGRGGRVHRRSLIGREPELIALRQALLEAEQCLSMQSNTSSSTSQAASVWSDPSRSSCVLLRGEPGIGKTRLAEELASESYVRGWTVLWSRAYNQERSVPYLFWTQILREALRQGMWNIHKHDRRALCYQPLITLLPEISDQFSSEIVVQEGTPEQEQWRLWEAVFMLLSDICEQHPLLLVLDDLHCADNSTVELLGYLVRRLRHAPLLIVGTYRDNELASTHPLALLLAHLQREHAVGEFSLPPLTAEQIAELVADAPEPFIRQIQLQVAGNPFFAEELACTMQQQENAKDPSLAPARLPDTITAVLGQRIGALSSHCQQFLSHAAILGNSFPFATLALMEQCGKTPFDEEGLFIAIEEALQARIISEEENNSSITYSFWHPLLQTHLYETLSAVRRARLHKQAATALQQLYAAYEEEGAASITYHLVRGGAASPLITHFAQLAGERAYRLSSYAEAEYYFAIAYEHLDASSESETPRITLLQYLGECTRVQGKGDDARYYYQQVLRHQEDLASPHISPQQAQLQAMIWYEIGLTWFETGDNAKALDCYAQGEQVLLRTMVAAGPAWARLRYEQSYVYWRQGDYTEARSRATSALRLFTETLEQQSLHREQPSPATRIRRTLSGDPVDLGRRISCLA